jgi:hypothetical protein
LQKQLSPLQSVIRNPGSVITTRISTVVTLIALMAGGDKNLPLTTLI